MMTEHIDTVITMTEQAYRVILARSWALLMERTPPDDAAAIQAACDLQLQLIQTGASWLAVCGQVLGLEQEGRAVPAAQPEAVTSAAEPPIVAVAADELPAVGRTARRRLPVRQHASRRRRQQHVPFHARLRAPVSQATSPVAEVAVPVLVLPPAIEPQALAEAQDGGVQATVLDVPDRVSADAQPAMASVETSRPVAEEEPVAAPAGDGTLPRVEQTAADSVEAPAVGVPGEGRRVFPLQPGGLPPRAQPTLMSFNGGPWLPISAWRRVFQFVLQTLQSSDPERFSAMASELTLQNGRPLFNRHPEQNLGPIDAGGGWYTTGQMPTDLIIQRLRRVLTWWGLAPEALEVELVPSPAEPAPTPVASAAPAATDAAGTAAPQEAPADVAPQPDTAPVAADRPASAPAADEAAARVTETPLDGLTVLDARSTVEDAQQVGAGDVEPAAQAVAVMLPPMIQVPALLADDPAAGAARPRRSRVYNVEGLVRLAVVPDLAEKLAEVPLAIAVPEPPDDAPLPAPEAPVARLEPPLPSTPPQPPRAGSAGRPQPDVPAEVRVPPARRPANVKWVKTARGTPLPLRPASSDDS